MEEKAIITQNNVIGRPFQKGNAGRPKGAKSRLAQTVKDKVLSVFNQLQDDPKHSLLAFAQKYPRDFYNIAAKLIPQEMKVDLPEEAVQIQIIMPGSAASN